VASPRVIIRRGHCHEPVVRLHSPSARNFLNSVLRERKAASIHHHHSDFERPADRIPRDRTFFQSTGHGTFDPCGVVHSTHGATAPSIHAHCSAVRVQLRCCGTNFSGANSDCRVCSLECKRPTQWIVVRNGSGVHACHLPIRHDCFRAHPAPSMPAPGE